MHMIRTLTGLPRDLVDPAIRKILVSSSPNIHTVATWARRAWPAIPPHPSTYSTSSVATQGPLAATPTFGAFGRKYQDGNPGVEDIPLDPDTSSVHTAWREEVYFVYNHVFWDVSRFLGEAAGVGVVGHFHPPRHEVFALGKEGDNGGDGDDVKEKKMEDGDDGNDADDNEGIKIMQWPTNILLMPAYVAPGVKVRVTAADRPKQDGADDEGPAPADEELGVWDGTNDTEVWYLRAGLEVKFAVEKKSEGESLGHEAGEGEAEGEAEGEGKGEKGGKGDGEDGGQGQIGGKVDEQASELVKQKEGVSAVFVVGVLCTVNHEEAAALEA